MQKLVDQGQLDSTNTRHRADMNPEYRSVVRTMAEMLDGLGVAMCVFDQDDRVRFWNQALFTFFPEHQSKTYEGEPYADNLRRFYQGRLSASELPKIDTYIQAGIERHRAQIHPYEFEHRGRRIRVSSLAVEGVGRIRIWNYPEPRAQALDNLAGGLFGSASSSADSGRLMLDSVPDGLMICGSDGRIEWVNESLVKMYGLQDRASAVGSTMEAMYRNAWQSQDAQDLHLLEEGLKTLEENLRFSGAPFELPLPGNRFSRVITQAAHGREAFYAHVDISQIKRQQLQLAKLNHDLSLSTQQAQEASRSKSQFLANMSHEIRTPMNAIVGLLELLRMTPLNHEQEDYVAKTREATRSLLTLIDDILDLSKVEAGKMRLDPQPFRLDRLLQNLSVILSASVGNKPVEVLFDVEAALPEVLVADQQRLQQVLINLASNAVKFTHRGEVVVRLRKTEMDDTTVALEFVVEDTGIGIASEHQEQIFSGFSQAEASTTRRFGGTGLGLSISERLVQMMGGHIALESAVGVGSSFSFALRLPIAQDVPDDLRRGQSPQLPARTALVVDDSARACALTAQMVRAWGWTVETAADGEQALQSLAQRARAGLPAYDVVFLDTTLPGLDAWAVAARLREGQAKPAAGRFMTVMVAAHNGDAPSTRNPQEQALVDGFLVKPFTSAMLADAVLAAEVSLARGKRSTGAVQKIRRLSGMRVLVVEDNLINQHIAEGLLGAQGALVSLAGNGQLGVEAVAAASPQYDVVLMDVQMPVMDGFAATRAIRQELGFKDLPIVAMTANAMPTDRQDCLAAGMNDHIGKPFNLNDLVGLLLRLAGRDASSNASQATLL